MAQLKENDMAQIVKSSHPKTKSGQAYACGGQVKKFADGGSIDLNAQTNGINSSIVNAPSTVDKLRESAVKTTNDVVEKAKTLGSGVARLFKSPEATTAERAVQDAEMIRKASQ